MNVYKPDRKCPKCGGSATTLYQDNNWFIAEHENTRRSDGSTKKPGTIHRECERCHYSWGELPIDLKEPARG